MDRTDICILAELQVDGRISAQRLADKVGLSSAPVWRRVQKLEKTRVISSTVAILDPEKIGLDVVVIAAIKLTSNDPGMGRDFREMVANRAEILECYVMSGEYDYHLKIVCKNMKTYDKLLREHILPCKAVSHVNTSFVMRICKYTTALPLEK